jgi:hypothetical protein
VDKTGILGRNDSRDAQGFDPVQESIDQASRIENPGTCASHPLDCSTDHRVPSVSMMMGFHRTHSSERKAQS